MNWFRRCYPRVSLSDMRSLTLTDDTASILIRGISPVTKVGNELDAEKSRDEAIGKK